MDETLVVGLMVFAFILGTISGIFLGFVILGRHIQKEILGHGRWDYSPKRLIDDINHLIGSNK